METRLDCNIKAIDVCNSLRKYYYPLSNCYYEIPFEFISKYGRYNIFATATSHLIDVKLKTFNETHFPHFVCMNVVQMQLRKKLSRCM